MKKYTLHTLALVFLVLIGGACALKRSDNVLHGASPESGKPRPPIYLEYSINKSSDPGSIVSVRISGKPLLDVGVFKIAARLPAGVDLVGGSLVAEATNLASGQSISANFTIRAANPGTYYISLDGRYQKSGESASDTIAIPFQVGEAQPLAKPGNLKEAGGEKIIEMPAK